MSGLLDEITMASLLPPLAPSGGHFCQGGEVAGLVVMVKHFPLALWCEQERRMCRRPEWELLPSAVNQQVRLGRVLCRPFC